MRRSLITDEESSSTKLSQIKEQVLEKSGIYGELDGEISYNYTMAVSKVNDSMTDEQKENLTALRKTILSGTYDGEAFDFSVSATRSLQYFTLKYNMLQTKNDQLFVKIWVKYSKFLL